MKRRLILSLAILFAAMLLFGVYALWSYNRQIDIGNRLVSVIIEPGDNFTRIADTLLQEGVIRSRVFFVYPARLQNIDKKLTPGRYDFTGENSCRSVLAKLRTADFLKVRVTVPEGSPVWKVASIIASRLDLDSTRIVELNQDSAFLDRHALPSLEGFLFPETYVFPWGVSEEEVLGTMVEQYRNLTRDLWPEDIHTGLTRFDIIKLASIIEAETRLDAERPLVASVYTNRLRKRMKLYADPTVIYGLGGLDRPLYKRDLKKNTPYNTYLHHGLPPTPINSPGIAAIRAALYPADTDYYYFVADDSGGHLFSRTNAEHNRARRRIKAERENQAP